MCKSFKNTVIFIFSEIITFEFGKSYPLKNTNDHITKAGMKDCDLLGSIGRQSFLESYRSAPKEVGLNYMNLKSYT